MKTKIIWKTIPENFESHGHKWEIGKWYHVDGNIILCSYGFHGSEKILDAMSYVIPGWICQAMVKGNSDTRNDKQAWSDMMIVQRWYWTVQMSVDLAKWCAEYAAKYAKYTKYAEYAEYADEYVAESAAKCAEYAAEYAAKYAEYAAKCAAKYTEYAAEYAAKCAEYAAKCAEYAKYADIIDLDEQIEIKIKQLIMGEK